MRIPDVRGQSGCGCGGDQIRKSPHSVPFQETDPAAPRGHDEEVDLSVLSAIIGRCVWMQSDSAHHQFLRSPPGPQSGFGQESPGTDRQERAWPSIVEGFTDFDERQSCNPGGVENGSAR